MWCNLSPLTLFWIFSTNFWYISCRVFPGHFTTLVPYSSKIASRFCIMTGSKILFKNMPSTYTCSFHFSYHFLSHYLVLIFRIHHPYNRVKWSNQLEDEIIPKHFLLGIFNTFDDDDPLWSSKNITFYQSSALHYLYSLKPYASHFLSQELVSLRLSAS